MRKYYSAFLLFLSLAFGACSSSNDDNNGEQPSEDDTVQVVQPELPLPIVENYALESFSSLFVDGIWVEHSIYDVYQDGHLGQDLFTLLDGATHKYLKPIDNSTARLHIPVIDPRVPDFDRTVAYRFSEGNQLQIWDTEDWHYSDAMTVLEITTDTMRLLGPVYNGSWAPEAVAGLYLYRRLTPEQTASVEQRWASGEKWL